LKPLKTSISSFDSISLDENQSDEQSRSNQQRLEQLREQFNKLCSAQVKAFEEEEEQDNLRIAELEEQLRQLKADNLEITTSTHLPTINITPASETSLLKQHEDVLNYTSSSEVLLENATDSLEKEKKKDMEEIWALKSEIEEKKKKILAIAAKEEMDKKKHEEEVISWKAILEQLASEIEQEEQQCEEVEQNFQTEKRNLEKNWEEEKMILKQKMAGKIVSVVKARKEPDTEKKSVPPLKCHGQNVTFKTGTGEERIQRVSYAKPPGTTQRQFYEECFHPQVRDSTHGRDVTIVFVGESGSGKTSAMMGNYFLNLK
jgi:hypothetical protein